MTVVTSYDVSNEAVIEAPPEAVWDALVAEFAGARRWWVPHNTYDPGPVPADRVGGTVEVTIHVRGAGRPGPKLRFTSVTREVETARRLLVDYVAGVFRGTGELRLEPLDGGRTLLTMRWQTRPHGWVCLLARLVDPGVKHREATGEAFANLAALLSGGPARSTAAGERG